MAAVLVVSRQVIVVAFVRRTDEIGPVYALRLEVSRLTSRGGGMSQNGGAPLRSATIPGLATARAMLRPLGFTRERLARPNIGVARMWSETGPCNFSHRSVAGWVKDGIEAAGGTAFEFATISGNDGMTSGTQGRKGSLAR